MNRDGIIAAGNRELFVFFYRARGAIFAMRAVLFHQVYYLYSAATFAWCWLERCWQSLHSRSEATAREPGASDQRR